MSRVVQRVGRLGAVERTAEGWKEGGAVGACCNSFSLLAFLS